MYRPGPTHPHCGAHGADKTLAAFVWMLDLVRQHQSTLVFVTPAGWPSAFRIGSTSWPARS